MAEASAKREVRLTTISPVFIVPDVVAAAEYYRDVLGFRILGISGFACFSMDHSLKEA